MLLLILAVLQLGMKFLRYETYGYIFHFLLYYIKYLVLAFVKYFLLKFLKRIIIR